MQKIQGLHGQNNRLRVLMADAHGMLHMQIHSLQLFYIHFILLICRKTKKKQYSQEETKILNERKDCEV